MAPGLVSTWNGVAPDGVVSDQVLGAMELVMSGWGGKLGGKSKSPARKLGV